MARAHYDLPSLNALATFEAAARHRGFKRAAGELNVTPAAVSHQIKALEQEIGQPLFVRHRRGVELNESGALLFAALQSGFAHIAETIRRIRVRGEGSAVTISATTAVSSLWLTPRLARFWKSHGHVAVDQYLSDAPDRSDQADLLIRYGRIEADSGDCRLLFSDTIRPLASPAFASTNPASTLEQLARLPLIHLRSREESWTGWQSWFGMLGYHDQIASGVAVNNYVIALQAAQDDMGVVLGWSALTEPIVGAGLLVPLTGFEVATPNDFYIKSSANIPQVALHLRDWLVDSVAG